MMRYMIIFCVRCRMKAEDLYFLNIEKGSKHDFALFVITKIT